ncbi:MAG: Eco57I restriction-modification methylase domain-containing protein, partial [Candidatus Hodarchaeales archaeon]
QKVDHANLKILDLSMGTGVILLLLLEWLVQNTDFATSFGSNILNLRKNILKRHLYGNEIDYETLNLAKFLLSDFCGTTDYSFLHNLKTKDFLLEYIKEREYEKFSNNFSLIITNPPYIALHSRFFKETLSSKNRMKLHSLIPEFSGKRDNYYLYFLGISLNRLEKEGVLAFVIDHSFFDLPSYTGIRKHILQNYSIKYLLNEFDYKPEATVDLGIIILQNSVPNTKNDVCFQSNINTKTIFFEQSSFFKRPHHSFDYIIGQDILDKLENQFIKLGEICSLSCGLEYGGLLKTHFLSPVHRTGNWYPVIDGSNSLPSKFIMFWIPRMNNSYVRFDKEFESQLVKDNKNISRTGKKVILISGNIERFHKRKIILRQSAKQFIGIIDDKKYLTLRNTHVLYDVQSPYSLEFILGFLSSSLANWIGINLNIIRSSGKNRYPQIRLNDLEILPIPDLKRINTERENLVKELEIVVKNARSIGDQISSLLTSIWEKLSEAERNHFKSQRKFIKFCFEGIIKKEQKLSVEKQNLIEPLLKNIANFQQKLEALENKINSIVFEIANITSDERKIIENFFVLK